jgi:hypothetical protein
MKKSHTQNFSTSTVVLIFVIVFAILPIGGASLVSAQKSTAPGALPGPGPRPGSPTDVVRAHPFEPAEELVYVAEFSRALLKKVDVADFRFTASRQPSLQKVVDSGFGRDTGGAGYALKFTGEVTSKGFFSKLFNLRFRERIESIVEPASFTLKTTKRVDEQGKRARTSETTYGDGKAFWVERDPKDPSRPPRTADATFTGQVQDVLSAIYYLRTQPLEVGRTFELTVSDSGLVYQVPVQVVEKKRKKTVLGRVETLRVDPGVFGPNRMIAGEGQFWIWFTNDNRRIPVGARIKMKYGTFDITLRKVIQNPTPRESLASTKMVIK